MGIEEKAKAYDMALEGARKELGVDRKEWEVVQQVLHNIFPDLRESEDERIRKCIGMALTDVDEQRFKDFGTTLKDCLAWLEKQKYPNEDYLNNPAFIDGFDTGREVQKIFDEQKPAEWSEEDRDRVAQYLHDGDGGMLWSKATEITRDILDMLRPQPKQEWSEEDEKMSISILNLLCSQITYVSGSGTTTGKQFPTYANERDWFKKRIKSLRPSWKPSEEQMEALEECGECKRCIKELYEQLKSIQ